MSSPNAYETSMIEKNLKEAIIIHAQAVHSKDYPDHHAWSVIIEKQINIDTHRPTRPRAPPTYVALVIVYTTPKKLGGWKVLEKSYGGHNSMAELEELLEMLQEALADGGGLEIVDEDDD